MKQGLSKREKVLIFCVGLLALIYLCIQFGIYPLYERVNDGHEELHQLMDDRFAFETNLALEASLRQGNDEARTLFLAIRQGFPPLMPNEEIDNTLTRLCQSMQLRPTMLRISAPVLTAGQADAGENDTYAAPIFAKVTATMNVAGDYSALVRLLDAVESINHIRLTQVSFSGSTQHGISDTANISLVFEVTLLNI
jgi:hypothetical protein